MENQEGVPLMEECRRKIRIYHPAHRQWHDGELALSFAKYGPIEYIFREGRDIIICFKRADSADQFFEKERTSKYKATRVHPQMWREDHDLPYQQCKRCLDTVSRQKQNRASHMTICKYQWERHLTRYRDASTQTEAYLKTMATQTDANPHGSVRVHDALSRNIQPSCNIQPPQAPGQSIEIHRDGHCIGAITWQPRV